MGSAKKILLVVDFQKARDFLFHVPLERASLPESDLIAYHAADYSEAIPSCDGYDETTLSGAGITAVGRFIEERRVAIQRLLRESLPPESLGRLEIDVDPHPARKILDKAEQENVDLILFFSPETRTSTHRGSVVEQLIRQSHRPVISLPVVEAGALAAAIDEAA